MTSWRTLRAVALGATAMVSMVGVVGIASASAKVRTKHALITGRLDASGYTIVALGTNGHMTSSNKRSFSIPAPSSKYTLQLVSRTGRYAGPVVVGGARSKVIVGLQGAVKLGRIDVITAKGYARPARRVMRSSLDSSNWAWAKRGVPIGNGKNLGLVISPTKGAGPSGVGGDSDRSGIPNAFDIASDGRRIINSLTPVALTRHTNVVSAALAHVAQGDLRGPRDGAGTPPAVSPASWMSQMFLQTNQTVNIDAAGVTASQIDSTMQSDLNLKLNNFPTNGTVELDCNGLSWCSQGGTGLVSEEGLPSSGQTGAYPQAPFPATSLDPVTGFGEIVGPQAPAGYLGTLTGSGSQEFSLFPDATSTQIGSGDVVTLTQSDAGVTTDTPITLGFVFDTVPAVASYSDTASDSGTVSYPDTSGLGTQSDPFIVAPGQDGDVEVTFNVYRPQRAGIAGAGEPAWMDIGNLWYALDYAPPATGNTVGGGQGPACPTADYSNLSPTLSDVDGSQFPAGSSGPMPGEGALVDSQADEPASPSDTISFTVNVSACLASKGGAFTPGRPTEFDISANSQSSRDHSNQQFWVQEAS
jgi:hypothetical protein